MSIRIIFGWILIVLNYVSNTNFKILAWPTNHNCFYILKVFETENILVFHQI